MYTLNYVLPFIYDLDKMSVSVRLWSPVAQLV